jgi:hypothetical protein
MLSIITLSASEYETYLPDDRPHELDAVLY